LFVQAYVVHEKRCTEGGAAAEEEVVVRTKQPATLVPGSTAGVKIKSDTGDDHPALHGSAD